MSGKFGFVLLGIVGVAMGKETKKEDKRVKYTKIFLKEALLKLMQKKRVDKITPTELCREADINRNTFYAHFSTVRDVLNMIEQEMEENILSKLRFDQPTKKVVSELLEQIIKTSDVCKIMLSPNGDFLFMQKLFNKLENKVMNELKLKKIVFDSKTSHYIFSYIFFGGIAILRCWFDNNMKESSDTIAELIINLTQNGIETYMDNATGES